MQEWKHGEEKGKGRCQEQRHRWSKEWDKLISLITKSYLLNFSLQNNLLILLAFIYYFCKDIEV